MGRLKANVDVRLPPGHPPGCWGDLRRFQEERACATTPIGSSTATMSKDMNAVDLASLLCSRLCHDLMSPVGALTDEDDPAMREKCLELLADSARASASKLKFFRLAFGAAGGFGDEIDTREAEAVLQGLFGPERRIALSWVVEDGKLPKGAVKLLLNLALLVGDALVRGGSLHVGAERSSGGIELAVRGEGPRILLDPELRKTLTRGSDGPIEARAAGAWLANALVAEAGGTIQISDPADEVLLIGVSLPGNRAGQG
jgi:histidine phosphotransferase ChpT